MARIDLPPPPYAIGNLDFIAVAAEFEEEGARSVLGEIGLEPVPGAIGGLLIINNPDVPRIGPVCSAQLWLNVRGYDHEANYLTHSRVCVARFSSTPTYDEIVTRMYGWPNEPGFSVIEDGGVSARAEPLTEQVVKSSGSVPAG